MKKYFGVILILILSWGTAFGSALTDDYVDIAASYVQEGNYAQAINYVNKALETEKGNINLLELQKDLYKLLGRDDILLTLNSGNNLNQISNYLNNAVSCYENGKYRESKENLTKYLEKMPQSDFAYMLRAKANMNIDETPSALRDIKSAQTISNNPEYELVEALILYKNGKYSQSRDILIKLSDKIQIFNVYKYLALCEFKLGNYSGAVENFDKAILLNDEDKTILETYNEAKRLSYGK